MLGVPAEVRNELNPGGAGADECYALVRQLVQSAARVSPGVLVVPTRRVAAVPLEVFDARNAGQFRRVVRAVRHHNEAGPDIVGAVRLDPPAVDGVVPAQRPHLGGKDRTVVEPEMLCDAPAVLEYLGAVGELLRGHEVELLEHRDVAVRVVVTLDSWEPVPVPNAAEVPAHFDDPDIIDAGLLQVHRREQAGDTSAEDGDLDVFGDRVAGRHRCVRVDLVEIRVLAFQLQVLFRPFGTQSLIALGQVLLPQRVDVDVVGGVGGSAVLIPRVVPLPFGREVPPVLLPPGTFKQGHAMAPSGSAAACSGASMSCTAGSTSCANSFVLSIASS